MCARKDHHDYYQPLADLDLDLRQYQTSVAAVDDSGTWVGARTYLAMLENV